MRPWPEYSPLFEAGRPAGLKPGTPLDVVMAFNLGPVQLPPDTLCVWRLFIDDRTEEGWQVSFRTLPRLPGPTAQPTRP